jgi:hypothetical protein
MTRVHTDARLALILLVWLIVVGIMETLFSWSCLVLHCVVIDGRVYEGGCTSAGRLVVALLLMAPAPLAAVAAMCRPRGSVRRLFGLVALVALELSLILLSMPGRVLTHPHLLRLDPGGRGWVLIIAEWPWDRGRPYGPKDDLWGKRLEPILAPGRQRPQDAR